jgi:hypothetical protein
MAKTSLENISKNRKWETFAKRGSMVSSARRPSVDDTVLTGGSRGTRAIDKAFLQQQFEFCDDNNRDIIEAFENDTYTSFGHRRSSLISERRVSLTASTSNGGVSPDDSKIVGHTTPNFIKPPHWASHLFSASRHHSLHLPVSSESNNVESCASLKSRRRNDSFQRFIVVVLCFGLSLMFAIFYGGGEFGLSLANMAYERKVTRMYGTANLTDPNVQEIVMKREVVYPLWWENQKGIPNMRGKGIQFSATVENHTADVGRPRPPGRVDTPFFWFTPRSKGNVIRSALSNCLHLVEASGFGKDNSQSVSFLSSSFVG